jgi:hypothetical protein
MQYLLFIHIYEYIHYIYLCIDKVNKTEKSSENIKKKMKTEKNEKSGNSQNLSIDSNIHNDGDNIGFLRMKPALTLEIAKCIAGAAVEEAQRRVHIYIYKYIFIYICMFAYILE